MPIDNDEKKAPLTLIRGGKTDAAPFNRRPFPEKIAHLRQLSAKKSLEAITSDPDGKSLVRALQPQELYVMFKEVGAEDALILFDYASPEQRVFFLDLELWEKELFSREKALEWLGYLVEGGDDTLAEQLRHLDLELLTLILYKEITVGGGVGELLPDDERTADWDHTFDNLYFISFRNPRNSRLIGTFLDIVFRKENQLYQYLLEGVKNQVESELEEEALAFRTGRLADMGFPSRQEAIFIYARIDPASFVPARDKKHLQVGGVEAFPVQIQEESLLARALRRSASEGILLELNYLINTALVAEETPFGDHAAMQAVMQRVSGYLCIALEFLCGPDEEKAADMLERETLQRLFQLGHAIVRQLGRKAGLVEATDYPSAKALNGMKAHPPVYFRGLDPDGIDGYREFRDMADVRRMESFLENLTP